VFSQKQTQVGAAGSEKETGRGLDAKMPDLDLRRVFSPTRDLARGAGRWGREVEVADDVAKLVCAARRVFDAGACRARSRRRGHRGTAMKGADEVACSREQEEARSTRLACAGHKEAAATSGDHRNLAGSDDCGGRRRHTVNKRKPEAKRRERRSRGCGRLPRRRWRGR
jgi:hypothetical protein